MNKVMTEAPHRLCTSIPPWMFNSLAVYHGQPLWDPAWDLEYQVMCRITVHLIASREVGRLSPWASCPSRGDMLIVSPVRTSARSVRKTEVTTNMTGRIYANSGKSPCCCSHFLLSIIFGVLGPQRKVPTTTYATSHCCSSPWIR